MTLPLVAAAVLAVALPAASAAAAGRIRFRYRSGDRWRSLAASCGGLAAPC
jgi:hypothetical protein